MPCNVAHVQFSAPWDYRFCISGGLKGGNGLAPETVGPTPPAPQGANMRASGGKNQLRRP